jgi:hypothetical protein
MPNNRVIPHIAAGYIEVVFDGHVDWMSATLLIEQIVAAIDELDLYCVLLDFQCVDMHVAVVEAPEVVNFFDVFANHSLCCGIIRSRDGRGDPTIEALGEGMRKLGHTVDCLESPAAVEHWIARHSKHRRRAG